MEKIKKYLFGIVMMLVSINVFAQEEPFTGDYCQLMNFMLRI